LTERLLKPEKGEKGTKPGSGAKKKRTSQGEAFSSEARRRRKETFEMHAETGPGGV